MCKTERSRGKTVEVKAGLGHTRVQDLEEEHLAEKENSSFLLSVPAGGLLGENGVFSHTLDSQFSDHVALVLWRATDMQSYLFCFARVQLLAALLNPIT